MLNQIDASYSIVTFRINNENENIISLMIKTLLHLSFRREMAFLFHFYYLKVDLVKKLKYIEVFNINECLYSYLLFILNIGI